MIAGKKWKIASFSDKAQIIEYHYGKNKDGTSRGDQRNLVMFMPDEKTGIDNTSIINNNIREGFQFLANSTLFLNSTGLLFSNYSDW